MPEKFVPGAAVKNLARGGRSTKSFLSEGRLQAVEGEMGPGNLLLIQFTHNDTSDLVWRHTAPWTSFLNNLSVFVDTARMRRALPVLMTPICRRYWREGVLQESYGECPAAMRDLAEYRGVRLLDMEKATGQLVGEMGDEASKGLYNWAPKGHPNYPDGVQDNTHLCREGAMRFARIALSLMEEKPC